MAIGVRQGMASFPGVQSVTGCTYTVSHGISPGTAVLRCNPQGSFPSAGGTLVISDGIVGVIIPKCKVQSLQITRGPAGAEWSISLVDKRWRWRDFGIISGCYNQLDPNGKLIPWMIRSPYELAVLCLQAMGETNYTIDMPAGLSAAAGQALSNFLGVGQNFQATGTNPPIDWECEVPAVALMRLCEQFGRRIVYNPLIDRVMIVRPGIGGSLPGGSISSEGPVATMPDIPDGVAVYGAPTKYQARFELEPVGKEWDGSYKPIDALSYAPFAAGAFHEVTWTINLPSLSDVPSRTVFTVNIKINLPPNPPDQKDPYSYSTQKQLTATETENSVLNRVATDLLANPIISKRLAITVAGNVMTLRAKTQGDTFEIEYAGFVYTGTNTDATSAIAIVRQGKKGVKSWEHTLPPLFPGVRATDRLTYGEAVELAQQSVYKCFQLTGRDVSGKGTILIPGFGRVNRRQQVYLLPTKVEQIVPEKEDLQIRDRLGRPIVVNFYNGYSRDMPACLYGQVTKILQNTIFDLRGNNIITPAGSKIFVNFSIDPIYQVVTTANYLYVKSGDKVLPPINLQLETGCNVRDAATNQFVSYIARKPLGNGALYKADRHPDVQLNVYATYFPKGTVKTTKLLENDAIVRGNYYLQGMVAQYFVSGGQTIEYNGIVGVQIDGAISQVTWEVGESGISTKASRNTEHDIWIPPYPARRRAELLAPIAGGNRQFIPNNEMRTDFKPRN